MALQSAINVAQLTGHDADTPDYERQMQSIRTAFNHCWNGYSYRHPSYHGATDDRVQALAIVSGLADSTKYEPIFNVIKTQDLPFKSITSCFSFSLSFSLFTCFAIAVQALSPATVSSMAAIVANNFFILLTLLFIIFWETAT